MTLVPRKAVILETCTLQENLTIFLLELLKPLTTKHVLSETSSACPSKMVEGGNGPSHRPLPKVLLRSKEESLKLNMRQWIEDYLPIVALPVSDESSLRATYVVTKSLYRAPIEIIPDDCELLTVWLFSDLV